MDKREGILELISVIREGPQDLIPVPRAISLTEGVGLKCRLACKYEVREESVKISMLSSHNVRPIEVEVTTPLGSQRLVVKEMQTGPDTWERRGSFEWPMDRFGLQLESDTGGEFITIFGPFMATLAHAWLRDATDPAVAVASLANAVAKLLTGKEANCGNYVGAGFAARHRSNEAMKLLREHLSCLEQENSS